jgi:cell division protein FtsZ
MGGGDFSLNEYEEIMSIITEHTLEDATIISGYFVDEGMDDEIRVTVIATGAEKSEPPSRETQAARKPPEPVGEKGYISMRDWEEKLNGRRAARGGELFTQGDLFSSDNLDIPAVRRISQVQGGMPPGAAKSSYPAAGGGKI